MRSRDLAQHLLVDLHVLVDHPLSEQRVDEERCLAAGADADGVHLGVEGLGDLGRLARAQRAGVVAAVGEQDDHLGLRLGVAQSLDRRAEGRADRGAVAGHADLQPLEEGGDDAVIEGQRALGERLVAEDDHADLVVLALLDEPLDHRLRHLQAVAAPVDRAIGVQVQRLHAARGVEHQDDVDALGLHLGLTPAGLRPRQAEDQQRHRQQPQPLDQPAQEQGARRPQPLERPGGGEAHRRRAAPPGQQPPEPEPDEIGRHAAAIAGRRRRSAARSCRPSSPSRRPAPRSRAARGWPRQSPAPPPRSLRSRSAAADARRT